MYIFEKLAKLDTPLPILGKCYDPFNKKIDLIVNLHSLEGLLFEETLPLVTFIGTENTLGKTTLIKSLFEFVKIDDDYLSVSDPDHTYGLGSFCHHPLIEIIFDSFNIRNCLIADFHGSISTCSDTYQSMKLTLFASSAIIAISIIEKDLGELDNLILEIFKALELACVNNLAV
jgi:hypothetical protein